MTDQDPATTDQALVRAALADRNAFTAIVSRYQERLRRYISRFGSIEPDTASDVLQEAFIKVYLYLNDYDPSLSFSAWLYRIARNETITHFRKQKNRPHAFMREEDTELFEHVADDLDIAHEADRALDAAALRAAVEGLDARYREAIILRYFEEKSYREISDIMQIPEGTVAAHISRAKAKLKDTLSRYDGHI